MSQSLVVVIAVLNLILQAVVIGMQVAVSRVPGEAEVFETSFLCNR